MVYNNYYKCMWLPTDCSLSARCRAICIGEWTVLMSMPLQRERERERERERGEGRTCPIHFAMTYYSFRRSLCIDGFCAESQLCNKDT